MTCTVDLFMLNICSVSAADASGWEEELDPHERQQLGVFNSETRRRQWTAARVLLRRQLQARLPGEALEFIQQPHGKPVLASGHAHFNLSHSGDWLALALCREAPVGIDLEFGQRQRQVLVLARRFFAPVESNWLAGLEEREQAAGFFRLWARKEAVLKAHGGGLSAGLDKMVFHPDQQWRLDNQLDEHDYQISDTPFMSGWLALASQGEHQVNLHWLDGRLEIGTPPPHLAINL